MMDLHTPPSHKTKENQASPFCGHLFIVSAPSGAGKSTLCMAVRRLLNDLAYSVSYTTRTPRPGEKEGVDYYFVSEKQFRRGIEEKRWAEWAMVHGNFYGSSAEWIERTLMTGRDILMDIDLQGAGQMVQRFPEAVTIFIMPPSLDELERRLRKRGTEDRRNLGLRLANAKQEIEQSGICRHVIVNDNLDQATHDLVALIERYRGE